MYNKHLANIQSVGQMLIYCHRGLFCLFRNRLLSIYVAFVLSIRNFLVILRIIKKTKVKVSIVKYNAGNIFSVINAVRRLGIEPLWTDDAEVLLSSDCVIFPGQGEASNAMDYLRSHNLDRVICDLKQPVLGICIGQQLLCKHSEEGDTECLGIFPMEVKRFVPKNHEDKIPQMGWNSLSLSPDLPVNLRTKTKRFELHEVPVYQLERKIHEVPEYQPERKSDNATDIDLFRGLKDGDFVYFVHSYYVPLHEKYTIARTNFTLDYSSAIHKDNFYATQFHPEKSGTVGERILRNFLELA